MNSANNRNCVTGQASNQDPTDNRIQIETMNLRITGHKIKIPHVIVSPKIKHANRVSIKIRITIISLIIKALIKTLL